MLKGHFFSLLLDFDNLILLFLLLKQQFSLVFFEIFHNFHLLRIFKSIILVYIHFLHICEPVGESLELLLRIEKFTSFDWLKFKDGNFKLLFHCFTLFQEFLVFQFLLFLLLFKLFFISFRHLLTRFVFDVGIRFVFDVGLFLINFLILFFDIYLHILWLDDMRVNLLTLIKSKWALDIFGIIEIIGFEFNTWWGRCLFLLFLKNWLLFFLNWILLLDSLSLLRIGDAWLFFEVFKKYLESVNLPIQSIHRQKWWIAPWFFKVHKLVLIIFVFHLVWHSAGDHWEAKDSS